MRDFRDAKAMARALRNALKAKGAETTHSESLELIATAFGYANWNILSAKIEAAAPASEERSPSSSGHRMIRRHLAGQKRPSTARSAARASIRCRN